MCHLASFSFFSLNSHSKKKKKAKIASISPYGLGLFCFGIYEHIPSSGWMRNRETSLWNVQARPGQMGPFEIYDSASRLTHPLYTTTLRETATSFPRERGGAAFPYLSKDATTGQFQENELLGRGGPGELVTMTIGSPSWATGPPAPQQLIRDPLKMLQGKVVLHTPEPPSVLRNCCSIQGEDVERQELAGT